MISRQPKIHVGLRIAAAGCIVLWLLAASYCNIEHLFAGEHHHGEGDAHEAAAHHDGDNSHEVEAAEYAEGAGGHDAGQPPGDSHHKGGEEGSCCSTLTATAQNAQPFFIAKPALRLPLNLPCAFIQAHDSVLAAPEDKLVRQANPRDWVFTPVVFLDAAHRSLAPPSPAVG